MVDDISNNCGGGDYPGPCGSDGNGTGGTHGPGANTTPGNGGGTPGNNDPPPLPKFSDCGGLEKQISFIKTAVIDPLKGKGSSDYRRFGLEAPKGILFYGPPGTGKTRLAQALGNEISSVIGKHVHFIYRKGKDVASKWFGQSSENLRKVFEEAIEKQPTVLFFDELDGLCPTRDQPFAHQPNVTIVTTMLGLMDNLPQGEVFVIGATNRLEHIDPALRRPGRFDKHMEFLPPVEVGRCDILRIHTDKWKIKPTPEFLAQMSRDTVGYSGADLAKLCLDAFDNAMSRLIAESNGNFKAQDFTGLIVHEKDWTAALSKMRPTNSAVFGSNLYTPSPIISDHIAPLLKSNAGEIVKGVKAQLPQRRSLNTGSSVRALHVFAPSETVLGNLDEYVISEALRSNELGMYTIYSVSPATLTSTRMTTWAARINEVFKQALESHQPSILYLQQVDELWNLLKCAKLGQALNLTQEVERLRGKFVLLLTSGASHPSLITEDNPLKKVLISSARVCEVQRPSGGDRSHFLFPIFGDAILSWDEGWNKNQLKTLDTAHEKAVEYTRDNDLGSVILLHDRLKQWLVTAAGHDSIDEFLGTMFQIIGHHRNMMMISRLPPPPPPPANNCGNNQK